MTPWGVVIQQLTRDDAALRRERRRHQQRKVAARVARSERRALRALQPRRKLSWGLALRARRASGPFSD
jgi:hypothetical protein